MKWFCSAVCRAAVALCLVSHCLTVNAEDQFPLTKDSLPQLNVPQGEVKGPFRWKSSIYPGTERDYWVYVPAQYEASQAACVTVVQDGLRRAQGWKLTTVLDNLIHKQEIPITIGIFIDPGEVPAPHDDAQPRFNRSFEYDSLGGRYARFLVEEILPEVAKTYNLSSDPNDRLIAGASSGAICAFNVAWERPDAFRRVLSTIGTYVGLRGGNEFPTLVRKTEPKPLRVFMEDGTNDLNLYGGSWWVANQDMLSALEWAGYEVNHAWGSGGHDSKHAAAILPDALRWLWRDYPEPVQPGIGKGAARRTDILIPEENWQLVSKGHKFTEGPAVNDRGEVYFTDIPNSRIHKIALDDTVTLFAENTGKANGLMFGTDGRLYACAREKKQVVAYSSDGNVEIIADDITSNDLVVGKNGIYFTDPDNRRVYHLGTNSSPQIVDTGIPFPNGIAFSPDQTLLYVSDTRGQFVHSFHVQQDGQLAHKQAYHHLHVPYAGPDSGADGMTVDTQGRLYVTTRMGIQVCDQLGRVHLIISKPQDAWLSNAVFGGENLDTLYVTCGDKVYKRRLAAQGVVPWREALKAPKPRL